MTIHWCGSGASAVPGIRRLLQGKRKVTVWNRTTLNAVKAVGDLTNRIHAFDPDTLALNLQAGDIVVSMLPRAMNNVLAGICVAKRAHFVTPSFLTPELHDHHAKAILAQVSLVGEVGLYPGIDHLMSRHLLSRYRDSVACHPDNDLSFLSYCGLVRDRPDPVRVKFEDSPLNRAMAMHSASRSIRNFQEYLVVRPWDAMAKISVPFPEPMTFEALPEGDALRMIELYDFDPTWRIKHLVRGTLCPDGWSNAWAPIFQQLGKLTPDAPDATLALPADKIWADRAPPDPGPDRVALCVSLRAERRGRTVFHQTYTLDAEDNDRAGAAVPRLVSRHVVLAVEALLEDRLPAGIQTGATGDEMVMAWLSTLGAEARHLGLSDHVPG